MIVVVMATTIIQDPGVLPEGAGQQQLTERIPPGWRLTADRAGVLRVLTAGADEAAFIRVDDRLHPVA